MLFLFNQYRILWAIISFSYNMTGTKSSMSPRSNDIKLLFLSSETIHKHCCYMHRFELITMYEPIDGSNKHTYVVTEKGYQYALETKTKLTSGILSVFVSLLSLVVGFILGKL